VYQASALVIVNGPNGSTATEHTDIFANQALALSYALLVTRDDVLKAVAQKFPGESVSHLRKVVSDSPLANTQIIEIRAQSNTPHMAATLANEVASTFIQLQMTKGTLSIAQQATPPDKPISPHVELNTSIAAMLSLLLMVVLALLLDWMDDTIKTSEDVIQQTGIEPLGDVPFVKSIQSGLSEKRKQGNHTALEDAFFSLGTHMRILYKGQRSLLVTGMRSGSGASTVATHLAIALAHTGMRILLVDANLCRPSLHTYFQCADTEGLVTTLTDMHLSEFEQQPARLLHVWLHQWKTHIPNLWLLPASPHSAFPNSLLHTPEMRLFVQWVTEQNLSDFASYVPHMLDMVIFDAPSIHERDGDVAALAMVTDATVMVLEAGKEHGETLDRARMKLERLGSPILGTIINRLRNKHHTYLYAQRTQASTAIANDVAVMSIKQPLAASQAAFLSQVIPPVLPETPRPRALLSEISLPQEHEGKQEDILQTKTLPALMFKNMGVSLPGLYDSSQQHSDTAGLRYYLSHDEHNA